MYSEGFNVNIVSPASAARAAKKKVGGAPLGRKSAVPSEIAIRARHFFRACVLRRDVHEVRQRVVVIRGLFARATSCAAIGECHRHDNEGDNNATVMSSFRRRCAWRRGAQASQRSPTLAAIVCFPKSVSSRRHPARERLPMLPLGTVSRAWGLDKTLRNVQEKGENVHFAGTCEEELACA